MSRDELDERRETGYYRPNPDAMDSNDVLEIPELDEVLDWCEMFEESCADDGVGSEDAFRHFDPHWGLYSLVAAVKKVEELQAYLKSLGDEEKGHIVRFDPDTETFNAQHPLHERVGNQLLDCPIHAVVAEQVDMGLVEPEGTWVLRGIPAAYIPGGPDQEPDWEWEKIDDAR
jgi:hypothetical protein